MISGIASRSGHSLAPIHVFAGLSEAALARLEAGSTVLEPRDGAMIFAQGDPADSVYAIVAGDGHVRIGTSNRRSKAMMVAVFHTGDIFGEIGAIDGGVRTAAALVEGRVRLVRIRAGAFVEALRANPSLGDALCRIMARRLRRTFDMLQDAVFETLEVRLARQVLYLAEGGSRSTPQGVRLNSRFRQSDLADLLGATTRSIITILNAWRAAGLVSYDTDRAILTILDMAALRAIVDVQGERHGV